MDRTTTKADVAVFIDFENVYVSVREKFDATPNFELIMDRCEDYGRIVLARAYADWYRYPRVTSALFANGVEPMYVPTYYYDREVGRTGRPIKNSVDIHLCIDAMRTLFSQGHIDKFVLVTGDRDFIPLVNAIRQNGKEVIIIGIGGAASAHLAQSGDEFLFYEQIADLKTPEQQKQAQKQERAEQRERDKAERPERVETNGKAERRHRDKPERERAPVAEAPVAEAPQPERTAYDTLVDAIQLARQRGFVSNLGSLKVLMRELDSGFNESKVKDSNGRPFTKFKDFVKEAERQGRVQIFTNGTVTEVFLPGENPMDVSQFAEDLASQQVERELENELEQEAAQQATPADQVADVAAEAPALDDTLTSDAVQPPLPTVPEVLAEPENQVELEPLADVESAPVAETATPVTSSDRPTFGEREWNLFRESMSQFNDPVRFAEIFSALRGLRNQEVFDLTNNELKELVKQAINRGMLQRTGRGARAYYRLNSQYRLVSSDQRLETQQYAPVIEQTDRNGAATPALDESAAGQVSDVGLAPALAARRGRAYNIVATEPVPNADAPASVAVDSPAATLNDVVADEVAVQTMEVAAPAKPRRNRRRKTVNPPVDAEAVEAEPVAQAAPVAERGPDDQPPAQPEASAETPAESPPKKRRGRRKKSEQPAEADGATE